jgi:hypothetical protein
VLHRAACPARTRERGQPLTHHGDEVLSYDKTGRVTKDGERVLEWDAKGRVSKVTRGDVVEEYTYAFDDERAVKKTTKAGTTTTVRYIDRDVEEREGTIVRYAFIGDDRIARLDGLDGETAAAAPTATASGGTTAAGLLMKKLGPGARWMEWLLPVAAEPDRLPIGAGLVIPPPLHRHQGAAVRGWTCRNGSGSAPG